MIYYYPRAFAMTRGIKKEVRRQRLDYQIGHLGELMEENYVQARRHNRLRYRPEHLKLLRGVTENPEVVDIAFAVLAERLSAKGVEVPDSYDERVPYDPDYAKIVGVAALLALVMTVLITAAVLLVSDVALMTTLIVAVSVVGAGLFIAALFKLVIPVSPMPEHSPDTPSRDR